MLFPIAQRAYFIPYRLMRCAIPIFGSLVLIETVNLVAPPASTPAFFVKVVLALALAAAMFLTHRNRSQKMGSGDTVFVVESS